MAVSTILMKSLATANPACTLDSVANGAGRVSAQVDNSTNRATRALVGVSFRTGTSPTANALVKVYLIRESNSFQGGRYSQSAETDLGVSDAAAATEPVNAPLIGTFSVSSTSNYYYEEVFQVYDPGPKFSILVWNASGAALHATQPTNELSVESFCDEAQ